MQYFSEKVLTFCWIGCIIIKLSQESKEKVTKRPEIKKSFSKKMKNHLTKRKQCDIIIRLSLKATLSSRKLLEDESRKIKINFEKPLDKSKRK